MHIVTIAKDGNVRYRSPTVSRPYGAIVARRRLRSRRVRESERRLPCRDTGTCSRLGVHVDYERAESTC